MQLVVGVQHINDLSKGLDGTAHHGQRLEVQHQRVQQQRHGLGGREESRAR